MCSTITVFKDIDKVALIITGIFFYRTPAVDRNEEYEPSPSALENIILYDMYCYESHDSIDDCISLRWAEDCDGGECFACYADDLSTVECCMLNIYLVFLYHRALICPYFINHYK